MLKHENYTSEHIAALRASTGADPSILERTVSSFIHHHPESSQVPRLRRSNPLLPFLR